MATKAVALLSGGLDSTLAAKLIIEQGIEVEALNFLTVFCNCTSRGRSCLWSQSAAEKLNIKLKVFEVSRDYLDIVKRPRYGYGSNMNPCLDCRIFMFKKAAQYMRESKASFLITGEVLGQRPMSQRKYAMRLIEKESGLEGLVLRPLSAMLLEPTIPEKEGIVDRKRLLSFHGRSRKAQMHLADTFGIADYPCASGGCLLTDPRFSARLRDLLKHNPDFRLEDTLLLKVGRHFRLNEKAKLVVGRDKQENDRLLGLAQKDDLLLKPVSVKGPLGIGKGKFNEVDLLTAASILARYCDSQPNQNIKVAYKTLSDLSSRFIRVTPFEEIRLNSLRI
jgi:tRNA U34 2-thiouridine synthase MnmA/TrmU